MTTASKITLARVVMIPVFMVPSVSRWMCWMRRELLMITVLVSVHSAVRQVL